MGIYTLGDIRKIAPPEFAEASDSDLIRAYAESNGLEPSAVADRIGYKRSTLDAVKETARQLVGGAVVDTPRMIGQGLKYSGTDDGGLVSGADARAADYAPNDLGSGSTGRMASHIARMLPPMAPVIAAGAVGGPLAGAAAGAGLFGGSMAQDKYEAVKSAGGSEEDATNAGRMNFAAQAALMGGAGHAIGGLARAAAPELGSTMDSVLNALTSTAVAKPIAKAVGLNLLEGTGTMVGSTVADELIGRQYGVKPEDMWEKVKGSAEDAVALTALLGPFAAGARMGHAKRAGAFDAALNSPDAPPELRAGAEQAVVEHAVKAGVPADQIQAWRDQRAAPVTLPDATGNVVAPVGASLLHGDTPLSMEKAQAKTEEAVAASDTPAPAEPPPPPPAAPAEPVAPDAGVDPRVAQEKQAEAEAAQSQQQAAQEQQSRVEQIKQKIATEQAVRTDAENQLGGPEVDEKGKRVNKVPGRYVDTFLTLQDAVAKGKIGESEFHAEKENLIAALQTNDNKTLNDVRKRVDEKLNPKPEAEVKEAAPEAPAPAPDKPAVAEKPAKAKVAAPAPVEAAVEAPAAPAAVEPAPKPKIRRVPKAAPVEAPQATAVSAPVPVPVEAPAKPAAAAPKKFDNVPDLADAIAKENKLPQAVADAYTQAVLLGRPHAEVAKELGVGKSTVGDWTRQMTKLVDEAKGKRLERDAPAGEAADEKVGLPGETIDPSEAARDKTGPGESEQLADSAPHEKPAPDQRSESDDKEVTASGDARDEDNLGGEADLSDHDGNTNIATSPHGKGKTRADNNITAARIESLSKKWDQLNMTVPAEQRVAFKDLGSAQQDAFDAEARKSDASARRAHAAIWPGAHEGARYSLGGQQKSTGYWLKKIAGVQQVSTTETISSTPGLVRMMMDSYPALSATVKGISETRATQGHESAAIMAAADNLLNSAAQQFAHLGLTTATAVQVLSEPRLARVAGGIYDTTTGAVAISPRFMLPAPNSYENVRGTNATIEAQRTVERTEILAHELAHALDYAAGPEPGVPASSMSTSPVGADITIANGKVNLKIGPVLKEALAAFAAEPDAYFKFNQPLSDLLNHLTYAASVGWDAHSMDIAGFMNAVETATTELHPRLMEMLLTEPNTLAKLPEGERLAKSIASSTTIAEITRHIGGTDVGQQLLRGDAQGQANPLVGEGRNSLPSEIQSVSEDRSRPDASGVRRASGQVDSVGAGAGRPADQESQRPRDRVLKSEIGQGLPELDKPGGISRFVRSIVGDKLYRNFPSLLGALSTEQLADRFSEHPLVQKFSDAMSKMGGLANHLIGEANPVIRDWAKASKDMGLEKSNAFGKLLLDSTTKGMWPNKAFEDAAHDHLKPADIDPEHETKMEALRVEHNVLARAWDKTPAAFKELFTRIEAVNRANFDRHVAADRKILIDSYHPALEDALGPRATTIDAAAAAEGARDRKAFVKDNKLDAVGEKRVKELWDSLDSHRSDYDNRLEGPYFPKSRFGDHIVSYKSPEFRTAEKAVETAKDALDQAKDGAHAGERAEIEQEVAVTRRKLERATAPESVERHTADLKDAEARLAALEVGVTAARKTLQDRSSTLNDLKADDTHYSVEFHENREVAKQRTAQLEAFFGKDGTQVERSTRDEFFSHADRTTPAYANRIADHLVGSLKGTPAEEIRRTVREMYITNLPGSSALKNQLKRRNVPGVKVEEVQRAFATKAVKDAYSISRKTYMGELNEHTAALRHGDSRNEDAILLGNELEKRIALNASLKTNKAISLATNATYFAQLGMSPGFMLQQATQQWVNTAPMMAARHGVGTATRELAKGSVDAAKLMKVSFDKSKSKMSFDMDLPAGVKAGLINEHEATMLRDMISRGTIDISSSHDAGIAAGGGEMDTFSRAAQMMNWPVQQLEVMNRISTALAGFRAEQAKGVKEGGDFAKTNERATKYAEKLVSETHMNYASENRARFIHPNSWGGWGRIMFQFRAYQQGMGYLTAKNIIDGMRGDKEALKAAGYMTGMQLATAGMAGMPIPGAMVAVAAALYKSFTDDDDEKDLKEMFYQGVKSIGGQMMADAITKGIPAAFGVDVSGKLGAGTTFDAAPFARKAKDGRDMTAAYFMSIVGGAAGGQVANIMEALHQASQGEFSKAAMLMPGKALTDILKAEEYQRVGTKDSRGNQILSPEDISVASTIIKGLGLQPTEIGRVSDERSAFFEARASRNNARAKLLSDYAQARIAGDDTSDIMEAIQGFNERHHEDRIAMGALPVAVQKHREQMRNMRDGVPVGKRDRQLYDDVLGN